MTIPSTQPTAVICEDDPTSARVVREALTRCGFRILASVDTAMDAAHSARVFQPDVMVLDLMLPWVHGAYAISVIREDAPACAIVVCSEQSTARVIGNGATYVAPKGSVTALESALLMLATRSAR